MSKLSKQQIELISENYHMVKMYANRRRLYGDEFYQAILDGLIRAAESYDPNKSHFYYYFSMCARSEVSSMLNKRKTRQKITPIVDLEDGNYISEDSNLEYYKLLDEMLSKLTGRDRDIVLMRHKGYTHEKIAKELGIGRSSISKRLKEIKEMLDNSKPT